MRTSEGSSLVFATVEEITKRNQTEEELSRMTRHLLETQEQERARIARDLHDDFNQRLAMLAIGIEQLRKDLPNASAGVLRRLVISIL